MEVVKYSGIGLRKQNQDFILSQTIGENKYLFIVADGMGGYSAGDVAARVVAESINASLRHNISLHDSIKKASEDLQTEIETRGIDKTGCCLAALIVDQNSAKVFWIGDVRIYQFRNNEQIFITRDHTLINEIEKYGPISFERRKKYEHIVTRALMGSLNDRVEEKELTAEKRDEFIICSDGIYKKLPVDALLEMIRQNTLRLEELNNDFDDNHSFIYIKI